MTHVENIPHQPLDPAADVTFLQSRIAELEEENHRLQQQIDFRDSALDAAFVQCDQRLAMILERNDCIFALKEELATYAGVDRFAQQRLAALEAENVRLEENLFASTVLIAKQSRMLNAMNRTIQEQSMELANLRATARGG